MYVLQEPIGKLSAPEMLQPSTSPRPSVVGGLESPVTENPSESDTGPLVALLDTVQNEPASPPGPLASLKPTLPACKLSLF